MQTKDINKKHGFEHAKKEKPGTGTVEAPIVPEKEKTPEMPSTLDEGKKTEEFNPGVVSPAVTTPADAPAVNPFQKIQEDIEDVLEEDLDDIYLKLTDDKKVEFKVTGEKTAQEISGLVGKAKATAKKVLSLIKDWLSVIPGINKYFLEQLGKIKTDKIMKIIKKNE